MTISAQTRARPRGLIVPALCALVGIGFLIGLGIWQIERKVWKENLIATLTRRLHAEPTALPAPQTWPQLDAQQYEFRRVTVKAELLNEREALVYTNGSAFRPDVSGQGYWVFTPARLPGGGIVMVDRGFVPEGRQEARSRAAGQWTGAVSITGALRWPEPRGFATPNDVPAKNLWFTRDPAAIANAKGLHDAAPFYIEQTEPVPPGGLPKPGPLVVHLRNEHLQYAITWFGLAGALAVVFALRFRNHWRRRLGADLETA